MTPLMTLIYATLAFLGGAWLAYVWQRQRIRQLEGAEAELFVDILKAREERDTQRLRAEAALDTLKEMRERRSEAGVKAWQTRKGGSLSSANGVVDGVAYNEVSDADA